MDLAVAQGELKGWLQRGPGRPTHVTELAAMCLRAVDERALNRAFDARAAWTQFRALRETAHDLLEAATAPAVHVDDKTRTALAVAAARFVASIDDDPASLSLAARAIAQALHDARASYFWSYFAAWEGPRVLQPGDPFPVPTATTLTDIYRAPFRLSPCPDTRETPHGLCPGGYRGLPSLRLVPHFEGGELVLDPSLERDFCPLLPDHEGGGNAAIIVPFPHLDAGCDYDTDVLDDGDRVFENVRPRDAAQLVAHVMADLRRAGTAAAFVVLPELTSGTALDDEIALAMATDDLGHLQLVVGGSAWHPPRPGDAGGRNCSTTHLRGREPHRHDKFSWFHQRAVGSERTRHDAKRITILAGPRITCTVLICKDVLEGWVPPLLQQLRVRLVLVPSCNPSLDPYRPAALSLSDLGWTTVVLANIPPEEGGAAEYALALRPAAVVPAHRSGHVSAVIPPIAGYNRLLSLEITSAESFDIDKTV